MNNLRIVDLSAIEARVLAWIADEADLVEKFRANAEIYCGFAAKVLGHPVRKPKKEGSPGYIEAVENKHKWARNAVGKIGILGCGYGMGAFEPGTYNYKVGITERTKPNYFFRDAGLGVDMADKIVNTYRGEYKNIVAYWKYLEKAFVYTAKYKKSCELTHNMRLDSTEDYDVCLTLPNGRELHYHQVHVDDTGYRTRVSVWNALEHKNEYLWGGTLTENVVQACSRDILMEAHLRCEDRGIHIAHRVHDELIGVGPEESAKEDLGIMIEEMCRVPEWGTGLPLNAEGAIANAYGGH